MRRRANSLPEWTRTIWASQTAKEVWEPRIARIGRLTRKLEMETVAKGHRRAAWIFVAADDLKGVQLVEFEARGLNVIPVLRQGVTGSYSASGLPYQEGQPYNWRCLVVRDGDEKSHLAYAFRNGDDEAIGAALGYPKCCRDFFARVWVREQWLDTTWPMATDPADAEVKTVRIELGGVFWPANILGRWFGVRAVPWLPCSFSCEKTVRAWFDRWEPLAEEIDAEALEWLETLLRANWRWSALHGIAAIETSIAKISTRTDACDELHTVDHVGVHELEAGTTGTRFPYHKPTDPQLTKGKSFAAGLEAVKIDDYSEATLAAAAKHKESATYGLVTSDGPVKFVDLVEDLWEHNGFKTREGMETAHDVLLRALEVGYEPSEGGRDAKTRRYIMDPGCGNGLLLEKLGNRYPHVVACGIECVRDRALAAYERLLTPNQDEELVVFGSLADLDNWRRREYDLVLVMPGRLLELKALFRAGVLNYLKRHARRLLVYAYDSPDHRDLESYAHSAGLLDDWRADFQIVEPGAAAATVCCPKEERGKLARHPARLTAPTS